MDAHFAVSFQVSPPTLVRAENGSVRADAAGGERGRAYKYSQILFKPLDPILLQASNDPVKMIRRELCSLDHVGVHEGADLSRGADQRHHASLSWSELAPKRMQTFQAPGKISRRIFSGTRN